MLRHIALDEPAAGRYSLPAREGVRMKLHNRWIVSAGLVAVAALGGHAAPLTYERQERIEVNTLGSWDKAVVLEVGKGEHEGEYKVHYDGYPASYDRWLMPVYFRKVAGASPTPTSQPAAPTAPAAAGQTAVTPRAGNYNINSYGRTGSPPLFLGHIQLKDDGTYKISRKRSGDYYGEGTYAFDPATSAVTWLSGPCKDEHWGGTFSVDGKTHKIRLRSTTIATCTID